MLKNALRYLLLICFAAFIFGFALIDMIAPAREFSDLENRSLAQSPDFSFRSLFNSYYMSQYEKYVNDQFTARDNWIALKSISESALGKLENNGVIYGADNYLFEKATPMDERQLLKNLGYIKSFARQYSGKPITFTIVPTSYAVLPDKLPEGAPATDQLGIIDECYLALSGEPLRVCDVVPGMLEHNGEYLYYRTDHHWTTFGAYRAYSAYMDSLGLEPVSLESLDAHQVTDFFGTYYSKAKNWNVVPDTITWYGVPVEEVSIDGETVQGIYDTDMFLMRDKYAAFLRSNNGLTVIKSAYNPAADNNAGKILVFKDSFGNSLVPFLVYNFSEVHVVDLRYFDDVPKLISSNDYEEIYILYNFSSFAQEPNIYKIAKSATD